MENLENKIDLIADEIKKAPKEGKTFIKFCFLCFGMASLLTWNTIITDLGFFTYFQSDYNVDVLYPFVKSSLSIPFQFVLLWKREIISYKSQLVIGLIGSIICIATLPFSVIFFGKNSFTGIIVSSVLILISGLICSLLNNGFFGLASFFPKCMIVNFSTGQGFSGIVMNIIQYVVLLIVNTGDVEKDKKFSAYIFFVTSGVLLGICLILLICAFKNKYFYYFFEKAEFAKVDDGERMSTSSLNVGINDSLVEQNKVIKKKIHELDQKDLSIEDSILISQEIEEEKEKKEAMQVIIQKQDRVITFCETFKLLIDIDLLASFIYIVTFSLFPAVCINQKLFKTGKYRIVTIVSLYNICDTIGRYLVRLATSTRTKCYIFSLVRICFLFLLPFNFYCYIKLNLDGAITSGILIVLDMLLGLSNGFASTLCLELAPKLVPKNARGQAGSSIGFFNVAGIFSGTCLAFLSKYLMKKIGTYDGN